MASKGETDQAIASTIRVHISSFERTQEKFVIGGLDFALKDEPHPPKIHKLEGKS
ncbi:hypothetical protein [Nostoc sp. LEGE 12450]|uniref:hypothetical protein n=1 Tax=Nostoc sp. LEGE 12450 TaxID=1828643 RepID=UPI0018822E76|nr:hypothetical protein [Nostoc sp. LEGE 12450]MBE8986403.1 hypothetical protein [Nostoc sp. LEGE 12450]